MVKKDGKEYSIKKIIGQSVMYLKSLDIIECFYFSYFILFLLINSFN